MLYDPRWEIHIKADPFSLESLIAWLEKMPADGVYCFTSWGECLLARWMRSLDRRAHTASNSPSGFYYTVNGTTINLHSFRDIASGGFALDPDVWTFGKALTRAREALASRA